MTADVLAGRITVLEGEDMLELQEATGGEGIGIDFRELAARADQVVAAAATGAVGPREIVDLESVLDRIERSIELWRYAPKLNA